MSEDETHSTDDDGYVPGGEEASEGESHFHNVHINAVANDDDMDHTTSSEENPKVVECSEIGGRSQSNEDHEDEAALDDVRVTNVDGDDGVDTPRASKSSLYSRCASTMFDL